MTRLNEQAAWALLRGPEDVLKARAHESRCLRYPDGKASYVVMRIVSTTNVCVADCSYCAFYRRPGDADAYVLSNDQIAAKIDDLVAAGGSLVAMEGGFNPRLRIEYYEDFFKSVRKRYGNAIEIYGPTIVEMIFIARSSRISLEDSLIRLKEAGLSWIPGGGAEILTDEWRLKLSPKKYSVREYLDGMEAAQKIGLGTTATMVIGFGESWKDRIEHLERVRALQDKTGGFASFLLWTYQPDNTLWKGERVSNEEYLKAVALSRLYLDNVPVIRASFLTQNEKGPEALKWGAHDFDIALEDQVTQLAGARVEKNVEKVLGWVKKAGFEPIKRKPF